MITIFGARNVTITQNGQTVKLDHVDKLHINLEHPASNFKKREDRCDEKSCDFCTKVFKSSHFLNLHIENKHSPKPKSPPGRANTPKEMPSSRRSSPVRSRSPSPVRSVSQSGYIKRDYMYLTTYEARIYNLGPRTTKKDIVDLVEDICGDIPIEVEFIKGKVTSKCFITVTEKTADMLVAELDGRLLDDRVIQVNKHKCH